MRPVWSGAISFGLVNIPIALYSATKQKPTVDLDLLRDSDCSRIRYKKVSEADGKEVPKEHIVKGYEYEKGKYVALKDEDFERVQIKSNQTVDIREFVELSEIEPVYFNEPYYLAPAKGGAKAYALLRNALERTGLVGIAKVVIRPPREHLAAIKPLDGILMLETLRFQDELRSPSDVPVPKVEIGPKELEMALSLVKAMASKWAPAKYHDEYRERLMELIEQKVKAGGKELPAPKRQGKQPAQGKIIDLVSLLQESLGQTQKAGKGRSAKTKQARAEHKKAA
jgi:DNA end-binding protein Ku